MRLSVLAFKRILLQVHRENPGESRADLCHLLMHRLLPVRAGRSDPPIKLIQALPALEPELLIDQYIRACLGEEGDEDGN